MQKLLDFENSYFIINYEENFSFKQKINSYLLDYSSGEEYYLLESIRAERINKNPLEQVGRYSITDIIKKKNKLTYLRIRNSNLLYGVEKLKEYTFKDDIKNIFESIKLEKMKEISFSDIKNEINNKIYCKVDYKLKLKKYCLFFEANYVNFKGVDNKENNFVQITKGDTIILLGDKIRLASLATYESINDQNIQFLIDTKKNIFDTNSGPFYKKIIKKIFLMLLKNTDINERDKLIKPDDISIKYFVKEGDN
jgi:hypothetical protein